MGGLPGRDAEDFYHQFLADLENADSDDTIVGGKVDLSKCFDRMGPKLAIRVLRRLGLPDCIAALLQQFYDKATAWFQDRGKVDPKTLRWQHIIAYIGNWM